VGILTRHSEDLLVISTQSCTKQHTTVGRSCWLKPSKVYLLWIAYKLP